MSLMELEVERQSNPVDMIEYVAANNDWSFERSGDDEIAMTVEGKWADYHVSFSWMEEFEALHLGCAFDVKVPEQRVNEVTKLLADGDLEVADLTTAIVPIDDAPRAFELLRAAETMKVLVAPNG